MTQIHPGWLQALGGSPIHPGWEAALSGQPEQSQPEGRSWAGEALTGLQRGMVAGPSQLLSAARAGAEVVGMDGVADRLAPYERGVSQLTDIVQNQAFPRSPRSGFWDARGIAGDLGETAPQLSSAIGAGMLPGGQVAAVAAFAGTAMAPVVGQTYQEAMREHGDSERAAQEAAANGAVTAVTSLIPGATFIRRVPGGRNVLDSITRSVIGRLGVRAVAEGGQEAAEQVGQIATEELVRRGASPEQAVAAVAGRLDEVGYAALLGSVMGAGASVGLEAATGRSAAPTLPQDRPVSQPTTGPSEVAPTQPEPATTPTRGPMAAAAVQTPEGVVEYVSRNPERAAQMPEKPSRGQMGEFGIAGNTTAQQRARIAADIRAEYRRQQAAGELVEVNAAETEVPPDFNPDADPIEQIEPDSDKDAPIPVEEDVQAMALPPPEPPRMGEGLSAYRDRIWSGVKEGRGFREEPSLYRAMSASEYMAGQNAGVFRPLIGGDLYVTSDPDRLAGGAYGGKDGGYIVEFDAVPTRKATSRTVDVQEQVVGELSTRAIRRIYRYDDAAKDHLLVYERGSDVQAMAAGPTPSGFNLPRQAVPVDPNRPQPITPGRVPIKGPISEHQIRTRMERDFAVPIRRGRVTIPGAAGIYKTKPEVVRMLTERFGDVGVAAHEVAHHIDQGYGVVKGAPADVRAELAGLDYDQSKARPSEGFAEFVRYAITHDDVAQRAPKTTAWFQQTFLPANPQVARKLGTARAMATQWRGQTPQQRVSANVNPTNQPRPVTTPAETVTDHVRAGWSKFYRQWVSDGDPVFEMVRAAKRRGSTFSDADNPYAVKSSQQLLGPHLGHEAVSGRGILSTRDYRVMHAPLRSVLSGIKDGEYGQFVSFLYARHAIESWSKGINPGITQSDAQAVYDEHKGNAAFVKAADGVTSFNNALIDMVAETGAISPSDAANMKAHWQTYIPLARAIGTKGSTLRGMTADLDNPFMGRHGADLPIVDPILTSMRRSLHLFNRAIQQNAIEALVSFAENNGGMGQFAERVKPEMMRNTLTVGDIRKQLEDAGVDSDEITGAVDDSDALFFYRPNLKGERGSIVRVYRNGEQQLWQLSPDLYESLETQARVGSDWLPAIAIRWASRATRLGATGINPAFTIPNLIRDLTTYFLQSKTRNPLRQAAAIPAAISRMATHHVASLAGRSHEGIVELYERMGGQIAGRLAADYAELAQARQKALDSPIQRKALRIVTPRGLRGVLGGTLNVVRDTINFTESAPRIAEFTESLRRDGITEADIKAGKPIPRESLIRAFNAASDVTTNFRRAGTKGRAVNQYVPFFNAQIQGIDKMLRTLRDDPSTALMRLTPLLAMTALMWAARKDDDEYKEEPDWLKYGFWNITQNGRVVARIPRPFDWGWVFLSGFEATLDAIDKRDPQVIQDYLAALTEKMAPNFIPAGVEQGIETTFNVDLFKSNLLAGEFVPIVDENGLGRFKDRDQTTPDSTLLARWAGQTLGMSPAKVDHFLDGVTGGATSRYMRFFETFDVQDFALSGVTVKNDYMRSIGDFYRDAAQAEKAWMSSRITDGNTDELGPGDQALADRNHAFGWYAGVMSELRDLVPKESTRDERYAVNRYIAGLARQAMGKEPLEQFPNPFQSRDLPPEVAAVIRQNREGLMRSARIDAQTPRSREQVRRARMMLRNLASPDPAR